MHSNRENSSAGRAQPCQGWGRGFEPRFPLFEILDSKIKFCLGGGIGRHAGLKILCPLGRAGSSPAWGTFYLIFAILRGNSSIGRASAFQAECCEFESRFPLYYYGNGCLGGGIGRHAGLKILCPLGRAGSSPAWGTKSSRIYFLGLFLRPIILEFN